MHIARLVLMPGVKSSERDRRGSLLRRRCKIAIEEQRGIKVILEALSAHCTHQGGAEVQKEGCWTLKNLAGNNAANKVAIAEQGGIRLLFLITFVRSFCRKRLS
jgi:hypothetical protein